MNLELKAQIIRRFGKQWLFARAAKVDPSDVSRAITGQRKVKPDQQAQWARILGCRAQDIFPAE